MKPLSHTNLFRRWHITCDMLQDKVHSWAITGAIVIKLHRPVLRPLQGGPGVSSLPVPLKNRDRRKRNYGVRHVLFKQEISNCFKGSFPILWVVNFEWYCAFLLFGAFCHSWLQNNCVLFSRDIFYTRYSRNCFHARESRRFNHWGIL